MTDVDMDIKWFAKADLSDYAQKYIAIVNKAVVSSGDDPGEVYDKATREHYGKEVILWKVAGNETLILKGE